MTTISPTSPSATGSPVAGSHDLDDQAFVDDHAVERIALIGDDADVGMQQAFLHRNPGRAESRGAVAGQRRAGDQRVLDRRAPWLPRHVVKPLEEIHRADKGARRSARITSATANASSEPAAMTVQPSACAPESMMKPYGLR